MTELSMGDSRLSGLAAVNMVYFQLLFFSSFFSFA